MKRVLGVDYGTKRVGIAVSDGLGLTAQPLEVVPLGEAVDRIAHLLDEYQVEIVVMGKPTGLSGQTGSSVAGAEALAQEIADVTGASIVFVDERFTSRMAEQTLLESGMKRRRRRDTVDQVAAAIILQTYLDSGANGGTKPPPETS